MPRLGEQFETSPNALNLVRLALALEVMAWHAHALRGEHGDGPLQRFVGDVGVDAFFAISGFLICRAWQRRPSLGRFLLARARRLLPGLWVCLAVTAFAIAPLACLVAGQPVPDLAQSAHYVAVNAGVHVRSWGIGSSPEGLTHAAWNGSLWSLSWEVHCYLAVAGLGLARLLRTRILVGAVALLWSLCVLLEASGVPATSGAESLWMPQRGGLMFGIGALLWCLRDRVVIRVRYAAYSIAATAIGVVTLSNYRIVGGVAVAYLCLYVALRLGRRPRLVLTDDLSYGIYIYAFPLQQALLLAGLGDLGWGGFLAVSVAATVPTAYLSWVLVERPLLGRRRQRPAASTQRSRVALAAPESMAARARSRPTASASATPVASPAVGATEPS